jgi:hypothetical protein
MASGAAMAQGAAMNVPPVLVVPLTQNASEGASLDLSGTMGAPPLALYVDTDIGDLHTGTVNWGDGSATESTTVFEGVGSGALGGTHTYADQGTYTVTVSVMDSNGGVDTKSFSVVVASVAPTGTLGNNGPVNEGGSATVSFTNQFDPSSADTIAGFHYSYDFDNDGVWDVGDGSYGGSVTSASQNVSAGFLPEGPGDYAVKGRILDKDGAFTDYTTVIHVNNVAPTLTGIAGDTINENEVATISATIVDPGGADTFSVNVDWLDGSTATITGLGASDTSGMVGDTTYQWTAATRQLQLSHQYLDDGLTAAATDTYNVSLTVQDDDGDASGPYTAPVVVNNIRPTLVVPLMESVLEGSTLDLSGVGGAPPLGLYVDPGTLDTQTATVDWGDGSAVENTTVIAGVGAGALGGTHIYADDGTYTVTVTVTDKDGGSDTKSFIVKVGNVTPQLSDPADITINENGTATLTTTVTDPGSKDVFSVDVNWLDGTSDTVSGLGLTDTSGTVGGTTYVWTAATRQLSVSHQYLDDGPSPGNGTSQDDYAVTLTPHDDDLGTGAAQTAIVTVKNVAPQISDPADITINENGTATLTTTITDPGTRDVFSVDVNWQDGSSNTITGLGLTNSSGTVGGTTYSWVAATRALTVSHTYLDDGASPGNGTTQDDYGVTLTAHDDDLGTSNVQMAVVTVKNVAPQLSDPADVTINENDTATLTTTITDPGTRDVFSVDVNWQDGSSDTITGLGLTNATGTIGGTTYVWTAATRQLQVSHQYLDDGTSPGNGTAQDNYAVTLTSHDDDLGTSSVQTATVTVKNVGPQISDPADVTINENGSTTLTTTITDPGTRDVFSIDVNWQDGSSDTITGLGLADAMGTIGGTTYVWTAATRQLQVTHQYLDDGPSPGNNTSQDNYGVTLTAHDDDLGTSLTQTAIVTVKNVAPTVLLNAVSSINENGVATVSGTYTDIGRLDGHTLTVTWGDQNNAANSTFTIPAVRDALGNLTLAVGNTFSSGDGATLTITSVDTLTGQVGFSVQHQYLDDGVAPGNNTATDTSTITVTVSDDDTASDIKSTTVVVSNVPPALTLNSVSPVSEDGVATLTGSYTDIGKLDQHTLTINWGDPNNTTNSVFTIDAIRDAAGNTTLAAGDTFSSADGATLTITSVDTVTGKITFSVQHQYVDDGGSPGNNTASDSSTITVTVADDDTASAIQTTTVTVNNVTPTLTLNSVSTITENGTATLTGSFTDIGKLDQHTLTVNWNDLNNPANSVFTVGAIFDAMGNTTLAAGDTFASADGAVLTITSVNTLTGNVTFSVQHQYLDDGVAPGNNTASDVSTISVTVADDDTGSVTQTTTVTVNNVAPQLSDSADVTIDENGTATLTTTITDPGTRDVFSVDVNWQDGTSDTINGLGLTDAAGTVGGTTYTWTAATRQLTVSHQYLDDGPSPGNVTSQDDYGVTLTAHDDDTGNSPTQTAIVTVKNVAPQLSTPAPVTINENSTATITTTLTDPGTQDVFSIDVNWGDGSTATISGLTFTTDASGTIGTTVFSWNSATGELTLSHHYFDDDPTSTSQDDFTVTLTAHDDDSGSGTTQTTVTVKNVAPTIDLPVIDLPVINEGQTVTLQAGTFDDALIDFPTENFKAYVSWGDNTFDELVVTYDNTGGHYAAISHTYLDNDADNKYTIGIRVADDDMGAFANESLFTNAAGVPGVDFSERTIEVTVFNVNPTLDPITATDVNSLGQTTLHLTFSDPGADTFTIMVDWGDGAGFVPEQLYAGPTPESFTITHTYLGPPDPNNPAADIQIQVQILDDDAMTLGVVQDGFSNIEDTVISNPGAQVINVRIDTTPDVPKLEYVPKPINLVLFDQQTQPISTIQTQDTNIATSELATSTDRYLELQLISPEGKVVLSYRLKDEALSDLRSLFATLPDGHYKIYLVRTDNDLRRLVMDVFVRRGRIVDPTDESEGSRDRPPSEDGQQNQSQPPENKQQDHATEQQPKGAMQLPQQPTGEVTVVNPAAEAADSMPSMARLRWAVPLAGIGLVAQRGSWAREVNEAFDQADDRAWKRLRRAGKRRLK